MEVSVENLEFWLECEEFKKLKEGKKNTQQKANHIFKTYVQSGALNEVNLDSATKAATKAAIESGIRMDIFNLAQTKIEQLMAKDSYPRFLKSEQYLSLLKGGNGNAGINENFSEIPAIQRTTSAKESPRKANTAPRRNTCHATGENTRTNTTPPLVVQI